MKNLFFVVIVLVFNLSCLASKQYLHPSRNYGYIIENQGQWDTKAKYLIKSQDMNIWAVEDGLIYDLRKEKELIYKKDDKLPYLQSKEIETIIYDRNPVKMTFVNCYHDQFAYQNDEFATYFNYFLGNDSNFWARKIYPSQNLKINNLYDGIDAIYYFEDGRMRYDLVISPGANPEQILLRFDGQKSINVLNDGSLKITTNIGSFSQGKILAYQIIDGKQKRVNCLFKINKMEQVQFQLENYDKNKQLIIDPLVFSICFGGSGQDNNLYGNFIISEAGQLLLSGETTSMNFPETISTFVDSVCNSGYIFLSKISNSGDELLYSTLIGARNKNDPTGSLAMTINQNGEILIVGYSSNKDLPINDYFLDSLKQELFKSFLIKFNSEGSEILLSTYLFNQKVFIQDIKLTKKNEILFVGDLDIKGFPVTDNAYKKDFIPGVGSDAFILVLDSNAKNIIYSTYFGGDEGNEAITDFELDEDGNILFTGITSSDDFFTTDNAYHTNPTALSDGYITKLNIYSGDIIFSTSLGGIKGNNVEVHGICSDRDKNIIITGFFTTQPYLEAELGLDMIDPYNEGFKIFVSKIDSIGSKVLSSGYLGSKFSSESFDLKLDSYGNIYIVGKAAGPGYYVTNDAFQPYCSDDFNYDFVISKINPDITKVLYSTYFGGMSDEEIAFIELDKNDNLYLVGSTYSYDMPVTNQDFKYKGSGDIIIAKFDLATNLEDQIMNSDFLYLFPNPAKNQINIKIKSEHYSKSNIEIYNLLGIKQSEFEIELNANENSIPIDVSSLSSGVYFVVFNDGNKVCKQMFIKE